MANLRKILKKKSLKGKEVAKAVIANDTLVYKHATAGDTDYNPVFSQSEIVRLVNSINDSVEGKIYNQYIALHQWIRENLSFTLAHEQQAELNITRLTHRIQIIKKIEEVYNYMSKVPCIMTQAQYERTIQAKVDEKINNTTLAVLDLIELALPYYLDLLRERPRKKNPLKALRKKYESETITDPNVLKIYNSIYDEGYYELPDGRRSDQMTTDEWQKAYKEVYEDPFLKTHELYLEGKKASPKDTLYHYRMKANERAMEKVFLGMEEEAAREEALKEIGFNVSETKWHKLEKKVLTKWEMVEADLFAFYPNLLTDKEELKAFRLHYKDLIDAVIKDVESHAITLNVSCLEDLTRKDISSLAIYNIDLYDYKAFVKELVLINSGTRADERGLAILQTDYLPLEFSQLDKNGDYKEPDILEPLSIHSLYNFSPKSDNYITLLSDLQNETECLKDSFYYMQGFNKALDLIIDHYDIPDISIYKLDVKYMEERIKAYNRLLVLLYSQVKDTQYNDPNMRSEKLDIIKNTFDIIDLKELYTPAQNIKQAENHLGEFRLLLNDSQFLNLMAIRGYIGDIDE